MQMKRYWIDIVAIRKWDKNDRHKNTTEAQTDSAHKKIMRQFDCIHIIFMNFVRNSFIYSVVQVAIVAYEKTSDFFLLFLSFWWCQCHS